jgi:ubiquitin-protein ligase
MPHTDQPLHIKVFLPNDFPNNRPAIQAMAQVTHPNIEQHNFLYKGPCVMTWNPSSSIATMIKAVHDDFTSQPPIPINVVGGLQAP